MSKELAATDGQGMPDIPEDLSERQFCGLVGDGLDPVRAYETVFANEDMSPDEIRKSSAKLTRRHRDWIVWLQQGCRNGEVSPEWVTMQLASTHTEFKRQSREFIEEKERRQALKDAHAVLRTLAEVGGFLRGGGGGGGGGKVAQIFIGYTDPNKKEIIDVSADDDETEV